MTKVAVLDDWQSVARTSTDWSPLEARAEVKVFDAALGGPDAVAQALAPFDVLLAMRERTAFPASVLERLPNLRMIALTGGRAPSLDIAACTARGVVVCHTTGERSLIATAELTLALMLAGARDLAQGDAAVRAGRFQTGVAVGEVLESRVLGVIGLGRIGARVAAYGRALGMRVLAWSPSLTPERAAEHGAERVERDALLAQSDVVTLHVPLSERTRGMIGAAELGRMKPGAMLVNTSRGPLVDVPALLAALRAGRLRAGIDVYEEEPLPPGSPWLDAPNCVLTPHLGYGTGDVFARFYKESIENILAFLDGKPIRMLNPDAVKTGA